MGEIVKIHGKCPYCGAEELGELIGFDKYPYDIKCGNCGRFFIKNAVPLKIKIDTFNNKEELEMKSKNKNPRSPTDKEKLEEALTKLRIIHSSVGNIIFLHAAKGNLNIKFTDDGKFKDVEADCGTW